MMNDSYTYSELSGDLINTLHTSFRSDREIVDRMYAGMAPRIHEKGSHREAIRIAMKGNKSFLYMLSQPHREFPENSDEIS